MLRICLLILVVSLGAAPAWACKYSVRDVGFVNLNAPAYRLLILLDDSVSSAAAEHLRQNARVVFMDANVEQEIVRRPAPDHDQAKTIERFTFAHYPAAVLLSPNGDRALPIELPRIDASGDELSPEDEDKLWEGLLTVIRSPLRKQIMKDILDAHSVVLVIEGKDEAANARAREVAQGAVQAIADNLDKMAKPVAVGPQLITIAQSALEQERITLWALGFDVDNLGDREAEGRVDGVDAHIAVIFGRMRKLGPLIGGPAMTQTQLQTNLSYIGEDCECELDRSWMQGVMLPHAWDRGMEAAALATLGFDPGDAMVRTEISRILTMGPGGSGTPPLRGSGASDPLLGYRETIIGEASPIEPPPSVTLLDDVFGPPAAPDVLDADAPPSVDANVNATLASSGEPLLTLTPALVLGVLGFMLLASFIGGAVVLLRARREI